MLLPQLGIISNNPSNNLKSLFRGVASYGSFHSETLHSVKEWGDPRKILFREGLKSMLDDRGDIEIAGEAEDGLDTVQKMRRVKPEMVLLDLSIPKISGISVMKQVKRDLPDLQILALTIHESDQYVLEAFDAGVDGYCIKDASRQELMVYSRQSNDIHY